MKQMSYILDNLATSGSAITNISSIKILEKMNFLLPPIELQNKFADFVQLINKSKFAVYSRYFLCDIFTFVSSTKAYSKVVSIFVCPNIC